MSLLCDKAGRIMSLSYFFIFFYKLVMLFGQNLIKYNSLMVIGVFMF